MSVQHPNDKVIELRRLHYAALTNQVRWPSFPWLEQVAPTIGTQDIAIPVTTVSPECHVHFSLINIFGSSNNKMCALGHKAFVPCSFRPREKHLPDSRRLFMTIHSEIQFLT